jgi:hypothetical protein
MGFENLYLFIFEDSLGAYYHKQGWSKIGDDVYQGHPVIVMVYDLNASARSSKIERYLR